MSRLILGLDLGESSLGGALIQVDEDEQLEQIVWVNSRVFSGVVDQKSKVTLNQKRRGFRGQRRTVDRKARRRRRIENELARIGLLPTSQQERNIVLGRNNPSKNPYLNPYELRAKALTEKLQLYEIGRALQHLLQRRGFRSNRKAKLADLIYRDPELQHDQELLEWINETPESIDTGDENNELEIPSSTQQEAEVQKDDEKEDPKKTLQAIANLENKWRQTDFQTIGAYLANELKNGKKVRKINRLSRVWLEEEFDAIWEKQAHYYPEIMTEKAKNDIRMAFEQRPLKPFRFILPKRGYSEIDLRELLRMTRACGMFGPSKPVARKGHWVSHRYRIIETLANLRININNEAIPLTIEQVQEVAQMMQSTASITWPALRKKLGYKDKNTKFTIEGSQGSLAKLTGNTTEITLKKILGYKWDDDLNLKPEIEQNQLEFMQDIETCPDPLKLFKMLQRPKKNGNKIYPLTKKEAFEIVKQSFSTKTTNYSVKAMRELNKLMLDGMMPHEAKEELRKKIGNNTNEQQQQTQNDNLNYLPVPPPLRNPRVHRCLYEVRRVVNALIDCYGMPDMIKIEMGREMKENKNEREARSKAIKEKERENQSAEEWYRNQPQYANRQLSRTDLMKYRLWKAVDEGTCLYCLKKIPASDILNDTVDIAHIIPRQSGDDSFSNKVLMHRECNAYMGDRLPCEIWPPGSDEWNERLAIVKKVGKPDKYGKTPLQRKFERTEIPEDFAEHQLKDTQYIVREAVKYLEQLNMKGIPWGSTTLKVWPTNGKATGFLRKVWEFNDILPKLETTKKIKDEDKQRLDHRHHALDAIVIALTTPKLYTAALKDSRGTKVERAEQTAKRYKPPKQLIKEAIDNAKTSHAVDRGIRGALHDAMFYGRKEMNNQTLYVRRIPIEQLYQPDARKPDKEKTKEYVKNRVYDPDLKRAILQRLEQGDWDTALKITHELPKLTDNKGNIMHVETVRVSHRKRSDESTINIDNPGSKSPQDRYVAPESNHHAEIIRLPNGKLTHRVVTMIDAAKNIRSNRSPYGITLKDGEQLVMTLGIDEIVEYEEVPMRVASTGMDVIFLRGVNDARMANDKNNCVVRGKSLSKLGRKLRFDPLGNLTPVDGP